MGDDNVFIIDFYNAEIYPCDFKAKGAIRYEEIVHAHTTDSQYMDKLERALDTCVESFRPDFILYNAGTDCMEGDPLGGLNVSGNGIVERDEIVFRHALEKKVPVLMVMSGGYQESNAGVIANSISNLVAKFKLI